MSVKNGKICCNCLHCIQSRDEKYGIIVCRCKRHNVYLPYAEVMSGWCKAWKKEQEGNKS